MNKQTNKDIKKRNEQTIKVNKNNNKQINKRNNEGKNRQTANKPLNQPAKTHTKNNIYISKKY